MNERGAVGGFEVLPFGLLVFVAGTLLLTNAWAVIDGTIAASAAAREATRTFAESADERLAVDAAYEAIEGHGRSRERAEVTWAVGPDARRCAVNTVVVRYRVPTLSIPFLGAFGSGVIETSGRHTEVVDPYRSGLSIDGFDPETCHA